MPQILPMESSSPSEDQELPDAPTRETGEPDDNGASSNSDHDMDVEENETLSAKQGISVKLEDLFDNDDDDNDDDDNDDDDNDDEYSSSNAANGNAHVKMEMKSSPPPVTAAVAEKFTDLGVMLAFYQRLFPFRLLFLWLNHSVKPSNDFAHREFAFTLHNDAYLRFQSFPTDEALRKQVLQLNPSRFEIGAVYTANPRDRKTLRGSSAFRPKSKELVFDIDLTDYDEIRTCCEKTKICLKCWQFVTMAVKVVDSALREDFGFENIMWVYSGRRGAHAWISDRKARELDDARRKALIGYLEVIKGGSQSGKKVNIRRPMHPHLARSLDILKDHFQQDILEDQDPWVTKEKSEVLLSLLPDKALNDALRKKWDSAPNRSSSSKWADIDTLAKAGVSSTLDSKALLEAKKDIILEYTYPRLDVEVGKKQGHLLKTPFAVHPGTGRVCVPIDPKKLDRFDPLGIPTVTELLGEIDEWDFANKKDGEEETDSKKLQDYEKTSLKPYVKFFQAHVAHVLKDERGVKREREERDAMEF
ncbi:hypothetical protein MMC25_003690 [Agyrium rufum]|nr:hypothetical protein [Agyrium rufum]